MRWLFLIALSPRLALADASPPAPPAEASGCPTAQWTARIDDDPDPLHSDVTPAVLALGECGLDGARAVLPQLGAEQRDTRMHADRALSYGVAWWFGWRAGRGFPAGSEERFRALWRANDYAFDGPPAARQRAIDRWRAWLAAHRR